MKVAMNAASLHYSTVGFCQLCTSGAGSEHIYCNTSSERLEFQDGKDRLGKKCWSAEGKVHDERVIGHFITLRVG